ncbi:hypothetical protein BMT98_10550 [Escherichia coli]|jgi:hypothetical protein|nr:hypothetical protein BMT98_10550 [Escherichia coli]
MLHLYNILPPEIDNDGDQRPPDEIVNIYGEYLQLSMNIMIASHTATQAERIISGSIILPPHLILAFYGYQYGNNKTHQKYRNTN